MLQLTLNQDNKLNQAYYIKNHSTNIAYYIYSWLYSSYIPKLWVGVLIKCAVKSNTGLFKMIVGVQYIVTPMDQEILKVFFYDVRCAVVMHFSRNWRYESEPPMKLSPLTCYKQFGTNPIFMLMFVESQRVHIQSTCKVCHKNLECCSIKSKNTYIPSSSVLCVWQVVKILTIILNNPVLFVVTLQTMGMQHTSSNLFYGLSSVVC